MHFVLSCHKAMVLAVCILFENQLEGVRNYSLIVGILSNYALKSAHTLKTDPNGYCGCALHIEWIS